MKIGYFNQVSTMGARVHWKTTTVLEVEKGKATPLKLRNNEL